MQLTRAADYAVRVMIHLAGLPPGARVSRSELSVIAECPEQFLCKVLQNLTRAGLVISHYFCMQLTRAADYAVRVMIHLAGLPPGARVSRSELSVAAECPEQFLCKVLQNLTRAGLVIFCSTLQRNCS